MISRGGAFTEPIWTTWLWTVMPSGRRNAFASAARRHARRGLAGARTLQHVAHVGVAELHHAGQVGVPGTREMHLLDLLVHGPGIHALGPVLVVAVLDQQRHRAAQRAPVADESLARGRAIEEVHLPRPATPTSRG